MQFSDYQNQPSSEKITLAILSASKRLMGWSLHSGSVYQLTGFAFAVIRSLEDSGTPYTLAANVGAIVAGSYFLDRSTNILYIQTSTSDNPNGHFLTVVVNIYLANVPIALPNDLASGFDVFWEPQIASTSQFGVAIDTITQTSEALEGTGTLTINNDFNFWPANFDKLSFENQAILIYSYNRALPVSEAQIIFKGTVNTRQWNINTIVFNLIDQFAELRNPLTLPTIGDLGARTPATLANASQRMILGRVYGHVPTNIDQVLTGYPIAGTVSITFNGSTVTGIGTTFLSLLVPNDQIVLGGTTYAINTVDTDTSLTLTQAYTTGFIDLTSAQAFVIPGQPKRYTNRIFNVAGHALREPSTTVTSGSTIETLHVASTRDFYAGDDIYVGTLGSGELVSVEEVIGENYLILATSLATSPTVGTVVLRPAIQNVRIEGVKLVYYRDYTFNATTATLTLRNSAEANAAPEYQIPFSTTFTNTSRTVTGTGFQAVITPGNLIGKLGTTNFFEVASVDSDTSLTLISASTISGSGNGRYKTLVYDPTTDTLTVDALGRTDDGTTSGNLLDTAPSINVALLTDAGLLPDLDTASFIDAEDLAYQKLGLVIPATFADTTIPIYRDVLNQINTSVFGALVQNSDFQFSYQVLRPRKDPAAVKFSEADILSFTLVATSEYVVKTVQVQYLNKEYDYLALATSIAVTETDSDYAEFLVGTSQVKVIATALVDPTEAELMANRWSFLLRNSVGRFTFLTKIQGMTVEIGDIIEIEHRKFFERYGGTSNRKLAMVESVMKSGVDVQIEATDLSNTFNRGAAINSNTDVWTAATETELIYGGYITDQYGLINNDQSSFETNLIW